MIENIDVFVRLALSVVLGMLLGIERIRAGKTAGLRTFSLVTLGSTLFIVISEQVIARYGYEIDPLRVASSLVAAVGFIGAGMIIFRENHIANLTTAAGIWLASAIGVAVGFGLFVEAIATTVFVIVTFTFMWNIESFLKKKFDFDKKQ